MNRVLALCVLLTTVAVVLAEDTYPTKWDNMKVGEIFSNDRLRGVYLHCLLASNARHCPEEGKVLRRILSDALYTECKKCSERQKYNIKEVIIWMIGHDAIGWQMLKDKYDPTGEYTKMYEEEAEKRGIIISRTTQRR